jgi:hypothetical protein
VSNKFLITGLPRIRSAWFSALLQSLSVDTCHDYQTRFDSLSALQRWLHEPALKGWCDPSAACLLPEFSAVEFDGRPIVIIERDEASSRRAFEQWYGEPLPQFDTVVANYEQFKSAVRGSALIVSYTDLEQYPTIAQIVGYCTGISLPFKTWQAFDLLRIEQHMPKVRALYAA